MPKCQAGCGGERAEELLFTSLRPQGSDFSRHMFWCSLEERELVASAEL